MGATWPSQTEDAHDWHCVASLRAMLPSGSQPLVHAIPGLSERLSAWTRSYCTCSVLGFLLFLLLEELKAPLEEYVNKRYPGLVKVVRNPKREGLIRARIGGWKVATGQITGFFDAHVEFTAGW